MDPRRRQTLQTSTSALPVPSSIPRPRMSMMPTASTGALRQSLAPTRVGRGSIAPGGSSQESQGSQLFSQGHGGGGGGGGGAREAPATVARSTNMYSSLGGSMSVSRPGVMPASERRTSTYGGRRQTNTFAATPLGGGTLIGGSRPVKDTRDFKSPETRKRYAADITAFLASLNFAGPGASGPATEKQLLQPTGVQFQAFFKAIVGAFDPNIKFVGELDKYVVPVLQQCMYPFASSISKSHLQSIGSQQSWPNMLAMLHWLVESIQLREDAFDNSPALHITEPPFPGEETALDHQEATLASWLDFATQCYPKFLAAEEFDVTEELEEFFNRLEEGRMRLRNQVKVLEDEAEHLKSEWDQLVAQPDPLVRIQEEITKCENDVVKMNKYMQGLENKRAQQKSNRKILTAKKDQLRKEREETTSQIKALSALIAAQGMSPLEIQNINAERTSLAAQHRAVLARASTKFDALLSLEVDVSRRMTSASVACATYQSKAESLGLLPQPPEGFEHVQFEQEINGASENPVPDCLTELKPAIVELRNQTRAKVAKRNGEDVVMEEQITRAKEAIAELVESAEADEAELEQVERDNVELKETTTAENASSAAEIERLQTQVGHLQSTMMQPLVVATWRYDQRRKELDAELIESSEVRQATRAALEEALGDILSYKEHMVKQSSLIVELAEADYLHV